MIGQAIPLEHALLVAAVLFVLGLGGLVLRRNIMFMLMCVEIMMNATGLAFVAGGARWGVADGQIMFILVLSLQASEACVGLALVILLYRRFRSLDVDEASTMKG